MINLLAPRAGEERYIILQGYAIGPYDPSRMSVGEVVSLPSQLANMVQSKGIWHENNVQHDKISGDITYHPVLGGALRSPTSTYPKYPNRIALPVWNGKTAYTVYPFLGMAFDRTSSMYFPSASVVWNYAIERNTVDPSLWTYYAIGVTGPPPGTVTNINVYRMVSIDKMDAYYTYYTHDWEIHSTIGAPGGINWFVQQTFDVIKNYCLGRPITKTTRQANNLAQWWKARVPSDTTFSPSRIREHIDAIATQLINGKFPIEEVDYGDLAMKASQKVNSNNVNMLEFLRDLRHPTEMIPKLRNLMNLKALSNDYLTVKYGILPTISDLQSIVDAFKKIGPYLDRNGFSTYSSAVVSTLSQDGNVYSLEQRIKLAIGNDDNELFALIKRLESMGTFPTFNNVWELMPYSFIIDWFIGVGKFLDRVDTRLRIMRLDIRYATMSRKTNVTGLLSWDSEHPYQGSVLWEHYHRWVSDQCPVPPLSLQPTFQDFNHWLESSALLLQRMKR